MQKYRRSTWSNKKIGEDRENLSFGIDGAVVKVNNLELREKNRYNL